MILKIGLQTLRIIVLSHQSMMEREVPATSSRLAMVGRRAQSQGLYFLTHGKPILLVLFENFF
jgi:hypothetical protein